MILYAKLKTPQLPKTQGNSSLQIFQLCLGKFSWYSACMVISLEKSFQSTEHLSYATQKLTLYNHNGLKTDIKRTTNFRFARAVKILSDSIFPCYLQLKHIK